MGRVHACWRSGDPLIKMDLELLVQKGMMPARDAYVLTLTRGSSATFIAVIHTRNHHDHEGTERDGFCTTNQGTGPVPLRPFVYVVRTFNRFRQGARTRSMPACLRAADLAPTTR